MTEADRVAAVEASGFTARQSRFLVLVLGHSGVCLPRQYRTFSGIAHGRETHRFFAKLIAGGFATTDLSAPAQAGRLYHLQYKPWYRLLGEPDHRHRRPMSVGRAVERLMVLDGVLAEREIMWLGLARDKVAAPAPLTKTGPANGAPGQGTPVVLTWTTTLTDPGYTVCWDQTNNHVCDTMWWPYGGAPGEVGGEPGAGDVLLAGAGAERSLRDASRAGRCSSSRSRRTCAPRRSSGWRATTAAGRRGTSSRWTAACRKLSCDSAARPQSRQLSMTALTTPSS